jgi:hypothetical protein
MATFTAKQQRALSQAPKRDRARLQQLFENQNAGGRSRRSGGRSAPANRSNANRVLAQGAGALPTKAFGAGKSGGVSSKKALTLGLNARLPYHLGLPRPVASYQVIRTSTLHNTSAGVIILSPLLRKWQNESGNPKWYHSCGVESVNAALGINASNNTTMIPMPMDILGGAADVVPAALTVQVMCPDALQSASGIYTMARVPQQMNMGGESRTWNQLKEQFDSYFKPRLLTAGKIALRGVTCNAIPIDMNEYSEFASTYPIESGSFAWGEHIQPAALSPILITHGAGIHSTLSLLITIEWRVRFDPSSAAAASHTYHPATPDGVWNDIMKSASDLGHGVEDIVDSIADIGAAV